MKKLLDFAVKNYFISLFALCILLVGVVSVYKLAFSKSYFVYAKVKLGQGLWWSSTVKPNIWLASSIKKGDFERGLTGKKTAEVISVRSYPWYTADQFDVYVTVKLAVGKGSGGKYTFKRSTIGAGSPIELELTSAQVTGTITEMSTSPFEDKLIERTVMLTKRSAYPWEFEAIKKGDTYFDGEENIFEVLDKTSTDTLTLAADLFGNLNASTTEQRKFIIVKAKLRVRERNGQYILGEDQVVRVGKPINISTPNFTFSEYIVGKIE